MEDLQNLLNTSNENSKESDNDDRYIGKIGENIEKVLGTMKDIKVKMRTYSSDLVNVLAKHEDDFLHAYKLHMQKIEKELA